MYAIFESLQKNVCSILYTVYSESVIWGSHSIQWIRTRLSGTTQKVAKIQTNLAKDRPAWVPQAVVSERGTLGAGHFFRNNETLPSTLSTQEREERLKWFFSQRKFPPRSLSIDTWRKVKVDEGSDSEFPTQDGFAITLSARAAHIMCYLPDNVLIDIEECQSTRLHVDDNSIIIGIYPDGKTMIQQQAVRGCGAACAAMLIEDHGKTSNAKSIKETNLATDKKLLGWLQQAGLKGRTAKVNATIKDIESFINQYGSIAVTVYGIGLHEIIIDSIQANRATIRDPFHGWRITIGADELLKQLSAKSQFETSSARFTASSTFTAIYVAKS